jgi:opacity protein-like surface antigen
MSYLKTVSGIGLVLFMASNAWAQQAEPAAEAAPAANTATAPEAATPAPADNGGYGSAALQLGYGTDDLSVGFGARGGYTLPMNVYLGANFMYYLGKSEDSNLLGVTMSVKSSIWTLMAEGGYDINLSPSFMLRPTVGLGLASAKAEVCAAGACTSASDSKFAFAPGVTASVLLGKLFLGADFKYLVISDYNAASFGGHVGMKF